MAKIRPRSVDEREGEAQFNINMTYLIVHINIYELYEKEGVYCYLARKHIFNNNKLLFPTPQPFILTHA